MYCVVHNGFVKCLCGDNMNWCDNWDGILDEDQNPSCKFIEDKEYADYVAEDSPRTGAEAL